MSAIGSARARNGASARSRPRRHRRSTAGPAPPAGRGPTSGRNGIGGATITLAIPDSPRGQPRPRPRTRRSPRRWPAAAASPHDRRQLMPELEPGRHPEARRHRPGEPRTARDGTRRRPAGCARRRSPPRPRAGCRWSARACGPGTRPRPQGQPAEADRPGVPEPGGQPVRADGGGVGAGGQAGLGPGGAALQRRPPERSWPTGRARSHPRWSCARPGCAAAATASSTPVSAARVTTLATPAASTGRATAPGRRSHLP